MCIGLKTQPALQAYVLGERKLFAFVRNAMAVPSILGNLAKTFLSDERQSEVRLSSFLYALTLSNFHC